MECPKIRNTARWREHILGMNPARGPPGHQSSYTSWLVVKERRVLEQSWPRLNLWEGSPVGLGPQEQGEFAPRVPTSQGSVVLHTLGPPGG